MDAEGTERNYHSQSSVAATASFLRSGKPSLLKSESAVIWLRFWFHRRNGAVLAHADAPLRIVAGSLWGNDPCIEIPCTLPNRPSHEPDFFLLHSWISVWWCCEWMSAAKGHILHSSSVLADYWEKVESSRESVSPDAKCLRNICSNFNFGCCSFLTFFWLVQRAQ